MTRRANHSLDQHLSFDSLSLFSVLPGKKESDGRKKQDPHYV